MAGWHAKPSGGYSEYSSDGIDNIQCISGMLNNRGYCLEAQAGMIANCVHESALNPWRWQNDVVNPDGGYGLFQFTPAHAYWDECYNFNGFAPNMSTSSVTAGAQPSDGYAQVEVVTHDALSKWEPTCWRWYWDRNEYPNLWEMRTRVINQYGSNGELSLSQFRSVANVAWATFAFLACYEGPGKPNFYVREQSALHIYQLLSGDTPPPPTPPPGPGPGPGPGPTPEHHKSKLIFYLKPYWKRGI